MIKERNDIFEIFKNIDRIGTEPTPQCDNSKNHNFAFFMHINGAEIHTHVFKCDKCGEMVKREVNVKNL
jgi:hypothetical protein